MKYGFAAVCVAPRWVPSVVRRLSEADGQSVAVCTVIGFPNGYNTTAVKAFEAADAIEAGATEIDMVASIGDLKAGNREYLEKDIAEVVQATRAGGGLVKVILETAVLTTNEIVLGCELAVDAGAQYVKTSTGFGPGGADPESVALIRRTVGPGVGVKAAGGVRTLADARRMLDAGASRLGSSSSVEILRELLEELS